MMNAFGPRMPTLFIHTRDAVLVVMHVNSHAIGKLDIVKALLNPRSPKVGMFFSDILSGTICSERDLSPYFSNLLFNHFPPKLS
jgi:hypothetical protein